MKTNAGVLACFVVVPLGIAAFEIACSGTGPDAPARSNGCIDLGCAPTYSSSSTSTSSSSSGGDPTINYPNPIDGTTKVATLVKGRFRFTEGPVWVGGRLLFTDVNANTIVELAADLKTTSVFKNNSGSANGLAVDKDGNLVVCEGGNKRVTRGPATKGAGLTPIATMFNGAQLNSPNDIVARSDGNVYFTDPNYSGNPNTQDDEAVYRIDPSGALSRLAQDFNKPNGVALAPNQNTLYVVDNGAGKLLSAPVDAAGVVGSFTNLADTPGGDGMAVDDANNLYVADDNGIDVFDKTGTKLGTITVPVQASNCTFGGADRKTLFITASGEEPADGGRNDATGLYSITLNVPGLP